MSRTRITRVLIGIGFLAGGLAVALWLAFRFSRPESLGEPGRSIDWYTAGLAVFCLLVLLVLTVLWWGRSIGPGRRWLVTGRVLSVLTALMTVMAIDPLLNGGWDAFITNDFQGAPPVLFAGLGVSLFAYGILVDLRDGMRSGN